MSNKNLNKLKGHLNNEIYGKITFTEKEKERVIIDITSSNAEKRWKMPLMQKILVNLAAVIVLLGLGTYVFNEVQNSPESVAETNISSPKSLVQDSTSDKVVNGSTSSIDEKAWQDRTITEGLQPGDAQNVKDFIAQNNEIYQAQLPEQYVDDPMHYYQIGATLLYAWLDSNYKVEGIAIEKDFRNLKNLAAIVVLEHRERYAHLDLGENENPYNYKDQWKEPSDRMEQAHQYIKYLLNDLNIAINGGNEGEIKGYAFMQDGSKTEELETFIGTDAEIKAFKPIDE